MKNPDKTAKLIAFFEGFTSVAKWDVNAYRIGYGSDTEGPTQIRVRKGMVTTRERALENLKARIPQFESGIIKQTSQEAWDKLGENTQAALLSFAYNYGHITRDMVASIMGHSPSLSWLIEQRESDNNYVNAKRRHTEAGFVASEEA